MSLACAPTQPIRAARKTEWLRCALAHHFSREPGVDNEIVVLATGIDQYVQEVFHHLAYNSSSDLVSEQDFRLLCSVLGVSSEKTEEEEHSAREDRDVCTALPPALSFREFHSRLCGFFTVRARDSPTSVRLPVTEETEHVEREIRLRCPRVRRRKCVSFDLSRETSSANKTSRDRTENATESAQKVQQRSWQEQVEMENAGLRELVEDLRSALQSSDARCMSLEVALKREHLYAPAENSPQITERQTCPAGSEPTPRQTKQTRRTKDLLRELELIRASRDGQLEEAMRFNQRLEEELMSAYGEVSRLEETVARLRRESAEIKRRAEEARAALAAGLAWVKDIQDRAQQVKPLQEKVQNLECHLETFRSHHAVNGNRKKGVEGPNWKTRSRCTCTVEHDRRPEPPAEPVEPTARVIPTGRDEVLIRGEEALQRAVEGQAASDEEEEVKVKMKEEGQCCLLEVKRLINKLHNCAKGCQKMALCHLILSQNSTGHHSSPNGCSGPPESKARGRRHHTLLDEKKTDKRISRRTLGKILMNTLELCNTKGQEWIPIFQVVEALCQQLISSEVVCVEEDVTAWRGVNPHHRNSTNSLLISC
ncbi:EF-hand and coiled-coil domain-containing protein 1 isoform X2 [Hemibagrus wyckioides]|uniref:EF-hand and coiled-coil domain-containing protein 1 isoform X2 n=1 Tax=Hemibagrus wyckioides TaxID=337641 RepID=UPI00266B4E79|nr:EF-hand and coiled-coil domain-containing protein 1 isoform X2 [Hemibagrus wyckioides]